MDEGGRPTLRGRGGDVLFCDINPSECSTTCRQKAGRRCATALLIIVMMTLQVVALMELGALQNTLVGAGAMQMTAACRKKVSIAVELVANPSILLLDVPPPPLPTLLLPPWGSFTAILSYPTAAACGCLLDQQGFTCLPPLPASTTPHLGLMQTCRLYIGCHMPTFQRRTLFSHVLGGCRYFERRKTMGAGAHDWAGCSGRRHCDPGSAEGMSPDWAHCGLHYSPALHRQLSGHPPPSLPCAEGANTPSSSIPDPNFSSRPHPFPFLRHSLPPQPSFTA